MRSIVSGTLLVAALSSAACHTMKPVSLEDLNVLTPDRVWVTHADHSVIVVFQPQVVGDSLAGYVDGRAAELPTAVVERVTVRRSAPARTVVLTLALAAGVSGALIAASGSGASHILAASSGAPGDCEKHPDEPFCQGTGSVR